MLRTVFSFALIMLFKLTLGQENIAIVNTTRLDSLFSVWPGTGPGMAVGVVKDGEVVYQHFSGFADRKSNQPITRETTFWVASVSKQFTAMAVTVLESEGKVNLDDPVNRYLPELWRFSDVKIRHLLHHTSGLRDGYTLVGMTLRGEKHYDPASVLEMVGQQKELNFKPGTRFEYVNSNYVLLALVIERVTKKPFSDFMQSDVFLPLGMSNARVYNGERLDSDAWGYLRKNSGYKRIGRYLPAIGSSGVMLSMDDAIILEKQFHQNDGDVRVKRMVQTEILNDSSEVHYTRGLEKYDIDSKVVYSHFGSDPGFRADILRIPEERLSVIIFSNASDYWSLNRNLFDVAGIVLEARFKLQQPSVEEAHTPLASFGGVYIDTVSGSATRFIKVMNDKLTASNSLNGYYADLIRAADQRFLKDDYYEKSYTFTDRSLQVQRVDGRHTFIKADSASFSENKKHLKGKYYSAELKKRYRITYKNGFLRLSFFRIMHSRLYPVGDNTFYSEFAGGNILRFNNPGDDTTLFFSRDGIKNLRFVKVR